MGGSALLFSPSQGLRLRAQPTPPLSLRPWTGPSSCNLYRRDAIQRCMAIRSEANKGVQSRRNSKSIPDDSRREQIMSFLNKIEASIKKPSAVEPKERSMAEQKKQHLEPKSYDKRNFLGHINSSGPPSNHDKLTREDSNRSIAPPNDNIKSSGPPPNFAKLTRDEGNRAVAPPHDNIKPSWPLSNFAIPTRDEGDKVVAPPHDDKKPSGPLSNFAKPKRDEGKKVVAAPHDDKKPSGPLSNFDKLIRDEGKKVVAAPHDNKKPSGPLSNFDKLIRDEGKKVVAAPHDNKKPSGPLSNFDKLIRDEGKKVVAAPHDDKKPSGPLSNFDELIRDGGNNVDKNSSGPLSFFDKLMIGGGKKIVKKPSLPRSRFPKLKKRKGGTGNYDFSFLRNDRKSPGPPSNFDILIRDGGDNAVSPPHDYKPPRPTSRFVRRSPIPISNPTKEETKTIPKDQPPCVIVRDTLEQEMLGSDEIPVLREKEDPSKSELEVEPMSELDAMTLSELRDIAKARGLKGYSKCKKAKLLEILKGTSL